MDTQTAQIACRGTGHGGWSQGDMETPGQPDSLLGNWTRRTASGGRKNAWCPAASVSTRTLCFNVHPSTST